jgi:flagellar hook-associated protein 3 FlgL
MGINRVSTYNIHQSLLRDATRSQTDLFNLQNQISSGLKTQVFSGLGNSVEQFADLESRLGRSQTYIDGNKIIQGRLDVADNALSAIIDTATDIKNLIALRRNSAVGDSLAFDQQIQGKWQALTSQLNISQEGRYIFSGTATDRPAVDGDNYPTLQEDGVPDAGYYGGSSQDITVRIEDNTTITYNVRADDPAFQQLFAGLAMARKYGAQSGESEQMRQAYDLVSEGLNGIIGVRAKVNANKVTVVENSDRLASQQLYWKGLKEEISNTDIVAVSTQVAVNQGVLQAAFQAFARISSLKLSDFLR